MREQSPKWDSLPHKENAFMMMGPFGHNLCLEMVGSVKRKKNIDAFFISILFRTSGAELVKQPKGFPFH